MRRVELLFFSLVLGAGGQEHPSRVRAGIWLIAAVLVFLAAGSAAHAVPIRSLPGLVSVQVFEATGGETLFNMTPNDPVVTQKRADRLSVTNNDFLSGSNEFYDFFYSDADGTFNIDGAFLTITAVFDNDLDSGLNITRARLVSSLPTNPTIEFANTVSDFVALGTLPFPATVFNALGDTPGTTTFLGDTLGELNNGRLSSRLSLTLGFASTRPPATIPEPSTLALFAFGLAGLGFMGWRRRTA